MAKVDSYPIKNSSNFFFNDAPSVSLEISLESPSKYDFDIHSLLSDNEERKCPDNEKWSVTQADSTTRDVNLSSNPLKEPACSRSTSLGALAKNHLENDRMLPELHLDDNFNLSDLLSSDHSPVKNETSSESLNLFDLCLGVEDILPNTKRTFKTENTVTLDDLANWMNSSHITENSNLLGSDTNHVSGDTSRSKYLCNSPVSFLLFPKNGDSDIGSSGSFDDILSATKSKCINDLVEADVLVESSSNSSGSIDSLETDSGKNELSDEASDGDFFEDIDLSFCIKKKVKDTYGPFTNSPETEDSGFDETDFKPYKLSVPCETSTLCRDLLLSPKVSCSFKKELIPSKQSLFSRALSAKPKIDNERKERLKKIRSDLLTKSLPLNLMYFETQKLPQTIQTINHSNESVVISSFLKISGGI